MRTNPVDRRLFLAAGLAAACAALAPSAALAQWSPFSGTVFGPDGQPANAVWVVLQKDGRDWRYLTGYDGRFFIGNLRPGSYRLSVTRDGRALHSATVTLPASLPHDIRLR